MCNNQKVIEVMPKAEELRTSLEQYTHEYEHWEEQTHPRQDLFLSSVDVHTQYSHQRLQPEALTIVCVPRHQNWNIS